MGSKPMWVLIYIFSHSVSPAGHNRNNWRHFYVRQLRDMKTGVIIEDFDATDLRSYDRICGWALARAHARSGAAAMIVGYMGSSKIFDDAMCEFAVEYADQAQRDHRAFCEGGASGSRQSCHGHLKQTLAKAGRK
jgi:hypothetical protein